MQTLAIVLLIVTTVICVAWYGLFFLYLRPYRCNVPGPLPLPLIGNWLNSVFPIRDTLEPAGNAPIECYWLGVLGMKPVVFVCDPELVREIAIDRRDDLHDRGMQDMVAFLAAGSKESILTSRGDLWKRQRDKLVPELASTELADDIFNVCLRQSDSLLDALASEDRDLPTGSSSNRIEDPPEIGSCPYSVSTSMSTNASEVLHDHLAAATSKGLFGFDDPANNKEYFCAGEEFERKDRYISYWSLLATLPMLPFSWWRRIAALPLVRRLTQHHQMEAIAKDHADLAKLELGRSAILGSEQSLVKAIWKLHDEDILAGVSTKLSEERSSANIVAIFHAASKNEAAIVCCALMELAAHPDVQQKLHQAIVDVLDDSAPKSRKQLMSIPYLDAVITEVLRLNPPFPLISKIAERDTELGGYKIGKNCEVAIRAARLQTDPQYWDRAAEFYPDRHIGATLQSQQDYIYLPFGVGRRQCPGSMIARMVIALHLCRIVQRFDVVAPPMETPPEKRVSITISYRGAIKLWFLNRQPLQTSRSTESSGHEEVETIR